MILSETAIPAARHEPALTFSDHMRAAVFAGPGQIRIEQVAMPQPGPGQICVRIEGCGLCGSNLGPWSGAPGIRYPLEPGAPGYEGWGVITALGEGVRERRIGERVAILSQHAYAQYDIVSEAASLVLPSELDDQPFPGEPLACAENIYKRSGIESRHTVAIVGIGFLGALLTQLCAGRGARVVAISRRPYALETARRCGARTCISAVDPERAAARVMELTAGKGCERVIEAVGNQAALDLATALTGIRGRLIIAGYHQDGARQVNMQLWNWRGLDIINAHERSEDVYIQGLREAIAAVCSARLDPGFLCTHTFGLEELPHAFDALQRRPEGFFKAWIRP